MMAAAGTDAGLHSSPGSLVMEWPRGHYGRLLLAWALHKLGTVILRNRERALSLQKERWARVPCDSDDQKTREES